MILVPKNTKFLKVVCWLMLAKSHFSIKNVIFKISSILMSPWRDQSPYDPHGVVINDAKFGVCQFTSFARV